MHCESCKNTLIQFDDFRNKIEFKTTNPLPEDGHELFYSNGILKSSWKNEEINEKIETFVYQLNNEIPINCMELNKEYDQLLNKFKNNDINKVTLINETEKIFGNCPSEFKKQAEIKRRKCEN